MIINNGGIIYNCNYIIIINLLYYQLRLPKQFTETKINIKSRIVERIRK